LFGRHVFPADLLVYMQIRYARTMPINAAE
jgi:hypothetical protein